MLVAFSCSLVGVVEVAAPVALLPAVAAATLFAREQRDFLAAAAATALLALRGLPHANLYAGYGVGWQLCAAPLRAASSSATSSCGPCPGSLGAATGQSWAWLRACSGCSSSAARA